MTVPTPSQDVAVPPVVTLTDQSAYLTVMRSLILTHRSALVLENFKAAREVEAVYADLYQQGKAHGWLNTDGSAPGATLTPQLPSAEEPQR